MSVTHVFGAAAFAALIAVPAFAETPPPNAPAYQPAPAAMPADRAGTNTSGVVLLSSPTPPDQAYRLKAGDPTVVSNTPVADTPANRRKYGGPMSNGGRRTAPVGN